MDILGMLQCLSLMLITLSSLLKNCFPNHLKIQDFFLKLQEKSPMLAKNINSRPDEEEAENKVNGKLIRELRDDENLRNPDALYRIWLKEIPAINHYSFLFIKKLQQPPKGHDFFKQLKRAYCNNYKQTMVQECLHTLNTWDKKSIFFYTWYILSAGIIFINNTLWFDKCP